MPTTELLYYVTNPNLIPPRSILQDRFSFSFHNLELKGSIDLDASTLHSGGGGGLSHSTSPIKRARSIRKKSHRTHNPIQRRILILSLQVRRIVIAPTPHLPHPTPFLFPGISSVTPRHIFIHDRQYRTSTRLQRLSPLRLWWRRWNPSPPFHPAPLKPDRPPLPRPTLPCPTLDPPSFRWTQRGTYPPPRCPPR